MTLGVDRPWPVKYEYRGIKLHIRFSYPDASSDIPSSARITAEADTEGRMSDVITGDWPSYEAAVEAAKTAAERWIDLKPND